VLKDNPESAESNFFSSNGSGAPLNNYNYVAGLPACTTTNYAARATTRWRTMAYGILDVPHRMIIQPIVQLPFGEGRRVGEEAGSRTCSPAAGRLRDLSWCRRRAFRSEIDRADNTGLLGGVQRPNLVPGVDRAPPAQLEDRQLRSADQSDATWL